MRSSIRHEELEKAMRIFEALSDVDEELLVRSEEVGKHEAGVISFWRYSKVMAACFCLMVVGGLTWGASKVMRQSEKSSDSAMPMSIAELAEEITADVTGDSGGTENSNGQSSMSDGNENDVGMALDQNKQSETDAQKEVNEREQGSSVEKPGADSIKQESLNTIVDTEAALLNPSEKISEKEAYATEALGSYIPVTLPRGYVFEGAYRGQNEQTKEYTSLSITWSKGLDSIFLAVEKVEPSHIALTDLSKPETYNVHLYEIPYGETVPQEYREAFDNPVFLAEDLSLELITMRMKTVQDSGDTDTPRGDFSVLYESGVLVRFNGDASPEEVWEMFQSVKQ